MLGTVRVRTEALFMALVLALVATTGCRTFVPFTQELRDQNRLSDAELKNLQFYVSNTITLRRELPSGGRQVTGNHKLLVVAGKTIEEVVIEAKTPGICVGVGPHTMAISFEQGTSVDFAPMAARAYAPESPSFATAPGDLDPFPGNRGRALDGRGDVFLGGYMVWVGPQSTVKFLGKTFDAVDDTAQATLLIDAQSLDQVVKQRTVLPGLRLPSK
jgi:hypothetical protein